MPNAKYYLVNSDGKSQPINYIDSNTYYDS